MRSKKIRRWQLFLITDDDDSLAARDEPQGIFRAYLAGFVDDEKIELDRTRRKELRHRDRAHQEHRFDLLDRVSRDLHESAQRHVAALAADLSANNAHAALSATGNPRPMFRTDASHRGLARFLLELPEASDERGVAITVKARKIRVVSDCLFPAGFRERRLDFQNGVLWFEPPGGEHAGNPGGSAGARFPVGRGEPRPFLEAARICGPFCCPLADVVEVDCGSRIGLKDRGGVEVKKFHGFGEQLGDFVKVGFEMVAMRGGAAVTGNAQDPLDIEARIERG